MTSTDDFLKSLSDFTKESAKIAKELLDKGYDLAKLYTELAKLNVELSNRKRAVEKLFAELGKLFYSLRPNIENERLTAVCDKITEEKAAIEKLEQAIESVKNAQKAEAEKGTASASAEAKAEGESVAEGPVMAAEEIICADCGVSNVADDEFCIGCGRLLNRQN